MIRAVQSLAIVLIMLCLTAAGARAQWAPNGLPVCQSGCDGDAVQVVSDGLGGAFIAWRDGHNNDDVFIQRIIAAGSIAPGWPVDGLPVAVLPSSQEFSGLAQDRQGGALVAWEDLRNGRNAYAQRVSAAGSFPPGWPLNGAAATPTPGGQFYPQIAPDGAGGAYVVWEDGSAYTVTGYDAYAQHLAADGSVAPGWPSGGFALSALQGNQGSIHFVMPDDSGGGLFVWTDSRPDAPGIYAQRINSDGTLAPGWPPNGIRLLSDQALRAAGRDEAGGFYVASATAGSQPGLDAAFYIRRFTFAGTMAPGWSAAGELVCNPPGNRAGLTMDGDGSGGALLTRYDSRPPYSAGEIFAQRVLMDGSVAPGWATNGMLVSDPANPMYEYDPFVAHDGQGGGYIVWQEQGNNEFPSRVQHVGANGLAAVGWPQYGLRLAPSVAQFDTRVAADGQGGAIVAWGERCCGRIGVWAQRYVMDGPVAVQLSLVGAVVKDGRVELDWYSPDAANLTSTVERRTGTSSWIALGSATTDGSGHIRYEDASATPGQRYDYRLAYVSQGIQQYSAETWVDVPAARLALEGARPNPAVRFMSVAFSLPDGGAATLAVIDVTGRVLFSREVGALGAGPHVVPVGLGSGMAPGIYWLRLSRGSRSLTARAVVVK